MAGLISLSRKKNIKGQPHKLAYITEAESDLLKSRGGAGKPVQGTKGVPAFYSDADDAGDMGGPSEGAAESSGGDPEGAMGFSPGGWSAGLADPTGPEDSGADPTGVDKSIDVGPKGFDPSILDLNYESYDDIPTEEQFDPLGLFEPFSPIDPFTATKRFKERLRPLEMLSDPVLQAAKTNPEYKKMYDDAIRGAAQSMSSNQILGTMQQNGIRDTTGYISSLERGGFDRTWGLGIRGDFEVQAPEGMTKEQYNNYIDLFMAHDGTQAGKLRMALDEVEKDSPKTVGSIFEKENIDPGIYGLDKNMNANRVSDYMDMKAMEGIVQGFPMAMSLSNPMMISSIFGSDAIKDIISEVNKNIVGTPIEDPANAAQKMLKDVKDDLTSVIPENKDIAERISELFGIPNQEYFNEKGFYNTPEPTIDSLVPENMIEASAPDTTGPENITDIGGLPAEDYLDPAVSEDVRRDVERQLVPSQRPLSDADTNKLMSMMNAGLDAYNTVPPSDTLTNVDRAAVAPVERATVAPVTNFSNNVVNNETLTYIIDSLERRGTPVSDIQEVVDARSEEELIAVLNRLDERAKNRYEAARVETNRLSREREQARVGAN